MAAQTGAGGFIGESSEFGQLCGLRTLRAKGRVFEDDFDQVRDIVARAEEAGALIEADLEGDISAAPYDCPLFATQSPEHVSHCGKVRGAASRVNHAFVGVLIGVGSGFTVVVEEDQSSRPDSFLKSHNDLLDKSIVLFGPAPT